MRTTFKLTFWLFLGSAALQSGCSSDRKHPIVMDDPLATATGFCNEWGKRACSTQTWQACLARDDQACASQQALYCISILPRGYAPDNANACLDAVGKAYTDARLSAEEYQVVTKLAAPCDKLIEGPGGPGDACQQTSDCNTLDDLVCVSRGTEPGTCQVPQIQQGGFPCGAPQQVCAPGFFCNGQNCLARRAEGSPCSALEPCLEQLACAGPEGSATCVPKGESADPCEGDGNCQSGICARSGSGTLGVCAPSIVLDAADPLCENLRQP